MVDSPARTLSTRAIEQVFRFCELPHGVIAQHVLDMHFRGVGQELIDAGALVPMAPADHIIMPVGPDDELFTFEWEPELQAYAAFIGREGWVIADENARRRWRLDLDWVLASIAAAVGIEARAKPLCLVEGRLWDLGDAWLGRRKRPVLFACGLRLPDVLDRACALVLLQGREAAGRSLTSRKGASPKMPNSIPSLF